MQSEPRQGGVSPPLAIANEIAKIIGISVYGTHVLRDSVGWNISGIADTALCFDGDYDGNSRTEEQKNRSSETTQAELGWDSTRVLSRPWMIAFQLHTARPAMSIKEGRDFKEGT
jgi:hypothetical protein